MPKQFGSFSVKVDINLRLQLSNPSAGIYPRQIKTYVQTEKPVCVYSGFTHTCQKLETVQMPFNWWMDKLVLINIHIIEHYLAFIADTGNMDDSQTYFLKFILL